jgi:hypothetical protein
MRPRNAEAARLQADYIARLRAALAGRETGEITEIVQSVQEHIEEALGESGEGEVTLVEMANVLERLGSPEDYASELPEPAPREPDPPPLSDFRRFDIGSCFNDAVEMYKRNFLPLVLAAAIYDVLSIFSLLILAGPLLGGLYYMCLRGMDRPDKRIDLGDMFRAFDKFWPLLALFFIEFVLMLLGFTALIVPGLLLTAIWLFTQLLMIDKNMGVFEVLGKSPSIVFRKGFGTNLLLAVICTALILGASSVPYVGVVLGWFVHPLAWLLITSAYIRQVRYDTGELDDVLGPKTAPLAVVPGAQPSAEGQES